MSKINKKYLLLDTSTNGVNSTVIPANYTPVNYTNTDSFIKGHLQGIDNALNHSPGDIKETSFTMANNVSSPANVTGFAFNSSTVRSFEALVSVSITATANLYQSFKINGINYGSSWDIDVSAMGNDSKVAFTITSAGQIQYTSGNISGFSDGTIHFRAISLSV